MIYYRDSMKRPSIDEQSFSQARFSADDMACIAQCRGDHNRLGFAYQVAFVRLFNQFPTQRPFSIDQKLLTYVALQLDQAITSIRAYSHRQPTIAEHQERIRRYLGLQRFGPEARSLVVPFIMQEASRLEDSAPLLACTKRYLKEQHILEPAEDTLKRLIANHRQEDDDDDAQEQQQQLYRHLLARKQALEKSLQPF